MTVRQIITVPDPRLRLISRKILPTEFPPKPYENIFLRELFRDMEETLRSTDGVGLAAVQIEKLVRILSYLNDGEVFHVINPEVVWSSHTVETKEEGCLSMPGVYVMVTRPAQVIVRHTTFSGGEHTTPALNDHVSRIVQHEIDHMNGVLITDHA